MAATPHLPTNLTNVLSSHTGPVNCVAFSNLGGTYILTGSSDRSIHLSRTEPASSSSSSSSSSSASNAPVTTATAPHTLPIQKYTSHGYPVLSLSVSQSNTHFVSSGGDRSVFYWDIQTPGSTLRRFGSNTTQGHTSRITCVSFAGDESDGGSGSGVIVSGSDDRSVRLWDVKSRDTRPLQVLEDAKDGVSCLAVWDKEVIAGSVDGRLRCYDVRMGKCTVDVQPGAVTSVDVSHDGKIMLVGCLDGRLRLMDRANGQCLRHMPEKMGADGYENSELRLQSCFGGHESLILSGSEADGKVRAWDVLTGKLCREVQVSDTSKVVSVVKWRDGSHTQGRKDLWAAGGSDGLVRIYG